MFASHPLSFAKPHSVKPMSSAAQNSGSWLPGNQNPLLGPRMYVAGFCPVLSPRMTIKCRARQTGAIDFTFGFPLCIRNKRRLAVINENPKKSHILETKTVSSYDVAGQEKNGGGKK